MFANRSYLWEMGHKNCSYVPHKKQVDKFKRECILYTSTTEPTMNKEQVIQKLDNANIPYTTKDFFSGFWGVRIIFDNRAVVKQARAVLGQDWVKPYFDKWSIELF
jgi:hypothetical protein